MLTKIRKGADSFLIRLLLGLIALSFVGIGGASFLIGNTKGDIVTFSDTDSISVETFLFVKSREIDSIQRENGINLSEEQIVALGIDNSILQKLINEAMIKYLANYYDFEISEDSVINFIKKSSFFNNKKGEFDLSLFKSAFHNSKRQEEEYLSGIKKSLVTGVIFDIFMESFIPPKMMIKNVVDYMAETRVVDIVYINLEHKSKDFKAEPVEVEELKNFYANNESSFIIPELRSFNHIKASREFFGKNLQISEEEIKSYYEENQDEFANKNYEAAKNEIRELLSTAKLETLMAELSKNFEEDVAAGLNLSKIAQKYDLEVNSVTEASYDSLNGGTQTDLAEVADSVFEMMEGELSYPIELPDQNEVLLVEVKNIFPSKQQSYEEVEDRVKVLLNEKALMVSNAKILEEFQKVYDPKNFTDKSVRSKGIEILNNKYFTRGELLSEDKFPPELLKVIFQSESLTNTPLIRAGNRLYFANIKSSSTNKVKAKKIRDTSFDRIVVTLKEGIMQELISHLTEKNKMKVKQVNVTTDAG